MSADGDIRARGESGPGSLSVTRAEELDQACNRFESDWRAGRRPRIDDRLVGVMGPERAPLVRELLAIELHWRHKAGERPHVGEYLERLLDDAEAVQAVFGRAETLGVVAGPPPNGLAAAPVDTLIPPSDTDWSSTWQTVAGSPSIPCYEVQDLLGRGGMGVVYRAVQKQLKRPVALKMIRSDLNVDPEQVERFRAEAESIALLRHPNVVQIYEIGESGGVPYFSLEMLEGGTLAHRLSAGPMQARQAATLTATLGRTIAAVHRVGIIHRDLKPSNVLFDVDGTAKVTDFGLAKRLKVETGQTVSGQVMGTPSYMAPEQAQGLTHQIGPAADIYALGAILYEMLTGRPPFKGPTILETIRQVVSEDPVPPSRLQPRVSRDLETICLKCLAKDAGAAVHHGRRPRRRTWTGSSPASRSSPGRRHSGSAPRSGPGGVRQRRPRSSPAWSRRWGWRRRPSATTPTNKTRSGEGTSRSPGCDWRPWTTSTAAACNGRTASWMTRT